MMRFQEWSQLGAKKWLSARLDNFELRETSVAAGLGSGLVVWVQGLVSWNIHGIYRLYWNS